MTSQPLFLYSTTVSDVGTVRANNQDSSFAGEHLAAICDGMGGHAGGDTASTIAIRSLAHIERDDVGHDVEAISKMMETSVMAAHDAIVGKARRERKLAGMGTTVTALALVGQWWVLAHIGDSRAYLLRDGVLERMTQDHSYVQHLIDTGHITPDEAKNHPQRNVVMRVLGDFDIDPHPDVMVRRAHPTDRWLLCSDGLHGVLEDSTIAEAMSSLSDQGECAQRLVSMALRAGSTDNVTAVIADATLALDVDAFDLPHQTPLIGGAASASLEPIADVINEPVASAPALRSDDSPAQRAAQLTQSIAGGAADHASDGSASDASDGSHGSDGPSSDGSGASGAKAGDDGQVVVQPSSVREENGERTNPDTGEIPVVQKRDGRLSDDPNDPEVAKAIHYEQLAKQIQRHKSRVRRRIISITVALLSLAALIGAGYGAYVWSQTKYYVGETDGVVAIYQGVPTNLFGLKLSHEVRRTSIRTTTLPDTWREELSQGIIRDSLSEAEDHVQVIRREIRKLDQQKLDQQSQKDSDSSDESDGTDASDGGKSDSNDDPSQKDAAGQSDGEAR